MNIDKNHVKTLLNALVNAYPQSVKNWDELSIVIGGEPSLIAHLVYLKEHGYIEGRFDFLGTASDNPWLIDLPRTRINAKGLDYAAELNHVPVGMFISRTRR